MEGGVDDRVLLTTKNSKATSRNASMRSGAFEQIFERFNVEGKLGEFGKGKEGDVHAGQTTGIRVGPGER